MSEMDKQEQMTANFKLPEETQALVDKLTPKQREQVMDLVSQPAGLFDESRPKVGQK